MKKLLFVIPTLGNGGAERSLVNLLNELPKDRYQIDLLLLKNRGMFLDQVPDNVNIMQQPKAIKCLYGPLLKSGVYLPVRIIGLALSKILKKGMGEQKAFLWKYFYKYAIKDNPVEYDVAIGYLGGETTYYVVDHVKAKRKLHWVHNDYRKSGMPKKTDTKLFKYVDAVITISEECLAILQEEFPQYCDKLHNIANITSSVVVKNRANEFYPEEYSENHFKLLSIGRLVEQKGFDLAIEAASYLKENNIEFKWYIIGNGALENSLKAQISRLGVEDYVELIGPRENPYPYIKNCDLFVQPSRYEGKSVVLDEAKILGKPILATAYPTVKDQLSQGNEGVIVDMNPRSISDGVLRMIVDVELRKRIEDYLCRHEYGNQEEVSKYIDIIEGDN